VSFYLYGFVHPSARKLTIMLQSPEAMAQPHAARAREDLVG
jgi:hypothetical protein